MPLVCACGAGLRHGPLAVVGTTHTHGLLCAVCLRYYATAEPGIELVLHRKRKDGSHAPWYYARAPHAGSGPVPSVGAPMTQKHMDAQNAIMDAVNAGRHVLVQQPLCPKSEHQPAPRHIQFSDDARAYLEKSVEGGGVTDVLVLSREGIPEYAFEVKVTHWTDTPRMGIEWGEFDADHVIYQTQGAGDVALRCIRHANPNMSCRRGGCEQCADEKERARVAAASKREEERAAAAEHKRRKEEQMTAEMRKAWEDTKRRCENLRSSATVVLEVARAHEKRDEMNPHWSCDLCGAWRPGKDYWTMKGLWIDGLSEGNSDVLYSCRGWCKEGPTRWFFPPKLAVKRCGSGWLCKFGIRIEGERFWVEWAFAN